MNSNTDFIFKILLAGDTGVGKSSIASRFIDGDFNKFSNSTIGVDFKTKDDILLDKIKIKYHLWDTGGHQKFSSIIQNYFTSIAGGIVVYDVTEKHSFHQVKEWVERIRGANIYENNMEIPILIFGNKTDNNLHRKITTEMGQDLAFELNTFFYEGSALNDKNISKIFQQLGEAIYTRFIGKQIYCRGIKGDSVNIYYKKTPKKTEKDPPSEKDPEQNTMEKFINDLNKKCIIL
jgi:small GTP-binding protein